MAKAIHRTGSIKIVRTANTKASLGGSCEEDISDSCCSGASIDVVVSNISDCGLQGFYDCTFHNGNTYTLTYASKVADHCIWNAAGGLWAINLLWYFSGANQGKIEILITWNIGAIECFDGIDSAGTTCESLPATVYNDHLVGNCGETGPFVEGYDGSCLVDWT